MKPDRWKRTNGPKDRGNLDRLSVAQQDYVTSHN